MWTNKSASPILVQDWSSGFKRIQLEMTLSAPEYWLEWTKNYFRCQFTHVGELIHKETWSAASFGWAEGLQMINPPIYRLTTAVSDIDQTNINRDIRDVYTKPFFTLKNHFENWTFHCTLHFWHCKKKTTLSVGGEVAKELSRAIFALTSADSGVLWRIWDRTHDIEFVSDFFVLCLFVQENTLSWKITWTQRS